MSVSMSGLNLDFLKKSRACKPGRYRIDPESGKAIPARDHARKYAKPSMRSETVALPMFVPDVDQAYGGSWKSIIDGTEISSRSNWREHNKRHGVVDVGDKFWSADGDDIKTTEEKMGYDPSLIGSPDFVWGKQHLD